MTHLNNYLTKPLADGYYQPLNTENLTKISEINSSSTGSTSHTTMHE